MISLEESYARCMEITRSHYENFPVASALLPSATRPAIAVIYAFARTADDFSDEEPDEAVALKNLEDWRQLLRKSEREPVNHPVFRAMNDVIRRYGIPVVWLDNLITAFERDRRIVRHDTFQDLVTYSDLSANPVGRLLLWVHGYRDERLLRKSDGICTALQLANFWQDVAVDMEKGRIYIPLSEIRGAGLTEETLLSPPDARHELLKRRLRAYTLGLFASGADLPNFLKGRLSLEIAFVLAGGIRILEAGAVPGRGFSDRPVLTRWDWAKEGAKVLLGLWRFPMDEGEGDPRFAEGRAVYGVA